MGTSDGISSEDWDIVHEHAVEIVNAADDEKPHYRHQLLGYLDRLEAKYGPLPSILATRADYLDDNDPKRESLLLRAYALAESLGDVVNLVYITQSLAEVCLEEKRLTEADRWLTRMREHLVTSNKPDFSEYERLRADFRRLAINSIKTDRS